MSHKLEPEDIKFRLVSTISFVDHHHLQFVNEEYGLTMEKLTNVTDSGFGKAKTYYFINGQEKEYTDLNELCKDWNEIKDFDDPNNEIVWVKKIVPIIKLNEYRKEEED